MTVIVLATALPLLGVAGWLTTRLVAAEREAVYEGLLSSARTLGSALEAEIGRHIAIAETLAQSIALQQGDFPGFRQRATAALRGMPGARLIVVDADGQQLMHSEVPEGTPLPKRLHMDVHQRVLETGRPEIADLRAGGGTGQPGIDIEVPVFRERKPALVLILAIDPAQFGRLLESTRVSSLAGIIDRQGRLVARIPDRGNVGAMAAQHWLDEIARRPEAGFSSGVSLDGEPYTNAYVRTAHGWTVGVAVTRSLLDAQAKPLWTLGLLGTAIIVATLALAALSARRVIVAARALSDEAGLPQRPRPFAGIAEFDEIASRLRHERDAALSEVAVRTRVEQALRDSEERFRTMADHAPVMVWVTEADGRCVFLSKSWYAFTGQTPDSGLGFGWLDAVHPEDRPEAEREFLAANREKRAFRLDYRLRRHDGEWRWAIDAATPRLDAEGQLLGYIGSVLDIHDRKRDEERIHLLMREVNHRAKNMLSLIQAMARRTAATSPADFVRSFELRLQGLSASQDLLVHSDWSSVDLETLIRAQLSHFGDFERIALKGPSLHVTASAAQTLGMALHELTTNAVKYGALSSPIGRVEIAWQLQDGADGTPCFGLSWSESGGPEVSPPARKGFGTLVVTDIVRAGLRGEVSLDYRPAGVEWRLTAPAAEVIDASAALPPPSPPSPAGKPEAVRPGQRILVVEDEPLIAMELTAILQQAGFETIGPAASVAQALATRLASCDAAILDVNLGRESSEAVARQLKQAGIPFIVLSGYTRTQQPAAFDGVPLLQKPVQPETLIAELQRCMGLVEA